MLVDQRLRRPKIDPDTRPDSLVVVLADASFAEERERGSLMVHRQQPFCPERQGIVASDVAVTHREIEVWGRIPREINVREETVLDLAALPTGHAFQGDFVEIVLAFDRQIDEVDALIVADE